MKIKVDLEPDEAELLQGMFLDYLIEHREMAKLRHVAKEITDKELDWHLGHAEYVNGIYKKLFGQKVP